MGSGDGRRGGSLRGEGTGEVPGADGERCWGAGTGEATEAVARRAEGNCRVAAHSVTPTRPTRTTSAGGGLDLRLLVLDGREAGGGRRRAERETARRGCEQEREEHGGADRKEKMRDASRPKTTGRGR